LRYDNFFLYKGLLLLLLFIME